MSILPHNNADIAGLNTFEAMLAILHRDDVNDSKEDKRLYSMYWRHLSDRYNYEAFLEWIQELEKQWKHFEERASSLVVEEENFQTAKRLFRTFAYEKSNIYSIEFKTLISQKRYLYACVQTLLRANEKMPLLNEIEFIEKRIQRILVETLLSTDEMQALLKEIELLEEEIQRSLV